MRHGESVSNRKGRISGTYDSRLTPLGRNQALELANILPSEICAAYSSDLTRARMTGKIALSDRKPRLTILLDKRIREVAQGELEGKRRRFIQEYANGDIDYAPTGGETYRSAAQRVVSFVIDTYQLFGSETCKSALLVFTHAGVIRIANCLFNSGKRPSQVFEPAPGNGTLFSTTFAELHIHRDWYS